MTAILRPRAGLPRVGVRVRAGEPVTFVAFGTSLTLGGQYLARLPAALRAAYPKQRVTLINRGRIGYMTLGAAFRVADDVLPAAPDLVLIEFAHNDATPDVAQYVGPALEGMLARIRGARPACEFAFVYLALAGTAAAGPTPAIEAYETIAERHGIPSFDLAALAEALVARGAARWEGAVLDALTVDGVHHGAPAIELLGTPFAQAFVELLAAPAEVRAAPDVPSDALTVLARRPVEGCERSRGWTIRRPRDGESRGAGLDEENVAEALEPGATLRLVFDGTHAFAWASGSGVLGVRVAETDERFRVAVDAPGKWSLRALMPPHPAARYTLDVIALNPGLLVGDVNLIGTLR